MPKQRTFTEGIIHYNAALPLPGTFKSQGQGECGAEGFITGWHGAVNCPACLEIIAAEKSKSFMAYRNTLP